MEKKIAILGIYGSLRKGSYNKIILEEAKNLLPENATLEIFHNLNAIPSFNQDREHNPPASVLQFKQQIQNADAILFSTPEYNYSIPGVLKNAIDWASRPYGESAWDGKPVALMSASTGMLGGARAQYQLRQVFVFLNMFPVNKPEVIIPQINQKVNTQGVLTDEHTKEKIQEVLISLVDWTTQLKAKVISTSQGKENYPYETHYQRTQQIS